MQNCGKPREVGGAVDRIDNPSMLATLLASRTALFGEDRVVRGTRWLSVRMTALLGFPVGLGHQIDGVGLAGDPDAA